MLGFFITNETTYLAAAPFAIAPKMSTNPVNGRGMYHLVAVDAVILENDEGENEPVLVALYEGHDGTDEAHHVSIDGEEDFG